MKCIIIFLLIFQISQAVAQNPLRYLQIGTSANAYRGDLQQNYDKWSSSFHAGIRFNKKERINGNLLVSLGSITGQSLTPDFKPTENPSIQPNSFFRSSIFTVQYNLQFNLLKNQNWEIFLSQGLGLIRYNPKDSFNNNLMDMNNTRAPNEAYNNMAIMFPTQAGINYFLKNNYGFGVQAGLLNTLTDYLDNISELGTRNGNDNILTYRFSFFVPIAYQ